MPTQFNPPRFRWLRRSAIAVAVLMIGLSLIRWRWGAWVDRQIEAQLAEWRAAGQPTTLADFADPPIADADNAAVALMQAQRTWQPSYPFNEAGYEGKLYLPLGTAEIQLIEAHLTANAAAMAGLRDARKRSGTAWNLMTGPAESLSSKPLPTFETDMLELARAAALLAHSRGDDAAAVEYLRDILFAADAIGEQPFMTCNHLSIGLRRLAYDGVIQIAPRLNAGGSPATPAQLAALMAALQDEATQVRQAVRALHGDRLLTLVSDRQLAEHAIPLNPGYPRANTTAVQHMGGFVVLPRVRLTTLRDARFLTVVADHIARGDWQAAYTAANAHPRPRNVSLFYPVAQAEHLSNLFSVSSSLEMQLRTLAARRAAANVLATRLYALEHDGRLPATRPSAPQAAPNQQ
jgi:hypothetical protein